MTDPTSTPAGRASCLIRRSSSAQCSPMMPWLVTCRLTRRLIWKVPSHVLDRPSLLGRRRRHPCSKTLSRNFVAAPALRPVCRDKPRVAACTAKVRLHSHPGGCRVLQRSREGRPGIHLAPGYVESVVPARTASERRLTWVAYVCRTRSTASLDTVIDVPICDAFWAPALGMATAA